MRLERERERERERDESLGYEVLYMNTHIAIERERERGTERERWREMRSCGGAYEGEYILSIQGLGIDIQIYTYRSLS